MTTFGPLNDDCPTEDELISFRALMLGQNAFFPEHLVTYRKHASSSSNPENFARFPLDLILKQMDDDLEKGVKMGLITKEQQTLIHNRERNGHIIRKLYRQYFISHQWKDLYLLIRCPLVSWYGKLSYLKQHIHWIFNK